MVNSKVLARKAEEDTVTYPVIMSYDSKDKKEANIKFIVLFTASTTGTVLWSECPNIYKVGHYQNNWVSCSNSNYWKKCYDDIIMSNS